MRTSRAKSQTPSDSHEKVVARVMRNMLHEHRARCGAHEDPISVVLNAICTSDLSANILR